MNKKLIAIIISFFLVESSLCARGYAAGVRLVKNQGEIIQVNVKLGAITEIEFEERVANVAKGVAGDVLQVETLENRIFVLPLQAVEADLYVVTQDNISYALRLVENEANKDNRVRIKKPADRIIEPQSEETVNTIEAIKSLILGVPPAGSNRLPVYKSEIFNNGWLRMSTDQVFELAGGVKAMILTAENLTDKPIIFPIQNIELPGLLAISADSQLLEARPIGGADKNKVYSTKVYLVVGDGD